MVWKEIKEVYVGSTNVRPDTVPGLCFTAGDAGATIALTKNSSPTSVTIEISTDKGNTWSTYTFGNTITLSNIGDKVLFRNASSTTTSFSTSAANHYKFTITGGKAGCSGDITYLLNKDGGVDTIPNTYCFYNLFYGATNLTTPPELPSTTIKDYCYYYMFRNCTSLTSAPELPATTLKTYCYGYMFSGCTSLVTAPELPATTLAAYCYNNMFSGCTSLTVAPELPSTTMQSYCYAYMFQNCTSLTTVSELPATILSTYCYDYMFSGCTSLTSVSKLPATSLSKYCYRCMFYNCPLIKLSTTQDSNYTQAYRIPTSGNGSSATGSLTSMFSNTGGTFTGGPTLNATYYLHKDNTIV